MWNIPVARYTYAPTIISSGKFQQFQNYSFLCYSSLSLFNSVNWVCLRWYIYSSCSSWIRTWDYAHLQTINSYFFYIFTSGFFPFPLWWSFSSPTIFPFTPIGHPWLLSLSAYISHRHLNTRRSFAIIFFLANNFCLQSFSFLLCLTQYLL